MSRDRRSADGAVADPARGDGRSARRPQHPDGEPDQGAAPAADPRPVGRGAAEALRRDRRHDRARRLRAAGRRSTTTRASCAPTPSSCCPPAAASSIDSKVPLDAYLEVLEAEDEASRERRADPPRPPGRASTSRKLSLEALPGPVRRPARRPTSCLLHPLRGRPCTPPSRPSPSSIDYALEQKILIATPTTLVGLLRDGRARLAPGARSPRRPRRSPTPRGELHSRMGAFLEHFAKAGRQLNSATKAYDDAVGSLESGCCRAAPHRGDGRRPRQGDRGAAPSRPRRAPDPRRVARDRRVQRPPDRAAKDAPSAVSSARK